MWRPSLLDEPLSPQASEAHALQQVRRGDLERFLFSK